MTDISYVSSSPSPHRAARQVAIPYLGLSLAYILCSDLVLERLTDDLQLMTWLQSLKGGTFILGTGVVLYAMVYWQVRRALQAERRNQEQEARFAHVFDYAVSGMIILTPAGEVVRVNDVALQMLDFDRSELVGTSVLDLTHPDDRSMREAYMTRQLEGERPAGPIEVRYRRKNGEYVWVLVSSVLLRDGDDQPRCFLSQVVNVTERRRAEEELQEHRMALAHASRLITLGELAAGLTHELTQPLTAIGQYADVAMRRVHLDREPVSGPMREAVDGVVQEAERAREIVERWRTYARGQTPRPAPADVNVLVHGAFRLLGWEARREGVRWRLELQQGLPHVEADRVQIEQVLVNLINNAIDALATSAMAPGEREIRVRTWLGDRRTVGVSVSDNGPGIGPDARPRLFEPFYTTKSNGIGLGLSISRSIVQSHGGQIGMDRRGGWTRFHFELPVNQEQSHVAA